MEEKFKLNGPCRGLCAKGCGRQNKQLNTYDYLADIPGNAEATDLVEVMALLLAWLLVLLSALLPLT